MSRTLSRTLTGNFWMLLFLAAALLLAGCQSVSSPAKAPAADDKTLGDTGIHVSGYMEAGGTTQVR